MTRAKFTVQSRTELNGGGFRVELTPVTTGSDENKEFFKWTPGGKIEISTINESAAEQFIPGKEVYVDFTIVE